VLDTIELPKLKIDSKRIVSSGNSSGGDMAIQFHVAFSKNVTGICGYDAQPWRCATTRFEGDYLMP
jgi:poly(3-hydroxybutyrate) depolymerase